MICSYNIIEKKKYKYNSCWWVINNIDLFIFKCIRNSKLNFNNYICFIELVFKVNIFKVWFFLNLFILGFKDFICNS